MRHAILFVIAVIAISLAATPARSEAPKRNPKSTAQLALQYDFLPGETGDISDASGKRHIGKLQGGKVVEGRNRNAVRFDGEGMIVMASVPATLNPASRSFTVGAFCQPAEPDGVVVAMGDKTDGFSLYLKGGVPQFVVRSKGALSKVAGRDPVTMGQWVHLAGAIDAQGNLLLLVNGWTVDRQPGKPIAKQPVEPLSVGADPGSPVGEYESPQHWRGLLQDVRFYWNVLERSDRDVWQDWADLPGCGCKK